MEKIGEFDGKEVYWLDYNSYEGQLPMWDWVCLAFCDAQYDYDKFKQFARAAINNKILCFGGHGKYGASLHDSFDGVIVKIITTENQPDFELLTTWHPNETAADAFWQYCYCYSHDYSYYDESERPPGSVFIKIVCTSIDGENRIAELQGYLQRFSEGWLPPDEDTP